MPAFSRYPNTDRPPVQFLQFVLEDPDADRPRRRADSYTGTTPCGAWILRGGQAAEVTLKAK